jgi:hypothetical protein
MSLQGHHRQAGLPPFLDPLGLQQLALKAVRLDGLHQAVDGQRRQRVDGCYLLHHLEHPVLGAVQKLDGEPQQLGGNLQQLGGNLQQLGGNLQQLSGNPPQAGGPRQLDGSPQFTALQPR